MIAIYDFILVISIFYSLVLFYKSFFGKDEHLEGNLKSIMKIVILQLSLYVAVIIAEKYYYSSPSL